MTGKEVGRWRWPVGAGHDEKWSAMTEEGEIPGQAGDDVEVAGDDEDRPSLPA